MSKRVKAYSELINLKANESIQVPSIAPAPFDIKNQYIKFKEFVKQQKIKQQQEWRSQIPFKTGFLLLFLLIIFLFSRGLWKAYQSQQQLVSQHVLKTEECLLKYEQKQCKIDQLNDDCRKYLHCMKSIPQSSGCIGIILQALSNTFQSISDKIIGPIMLTILGFLLKMIQILSSSKEKKD